MCVCCSCVLPSHGSSSPFSLQHVRRHVLAVRQGVLGSVTMSTTIGCVRREGARSSCSRRQCRPGSRPMLACAYLKGPQCEKGDARVLCSRSGVVDDAWSTGDGRNERRLSPPSTLYTPPARALGVQPWASLKCALLLRKVFPTDLGPQAAHFRRSTTAELWSSPLESVAV